MVWFALSFQDQVEKYGVYVGIASFFGLALLSVLYFSQARELKRLREWAGRAPERARDLEQRVVAQATATVARRAPQMPPAPGKPAGAIAPARRLAEMPAPAVAPEVADEAPDEEAATANGNAPSPQEAAAAAPDAAEAPADGAQADAPAEPVPAPGSGEAPAPAVPAAATAAGAATAGEETHEHALEETAEHDIDETGEHELEQTGEHEVDETGEHELEETGEHDVDETGEHELDDTGDHEPVTDDVPAVPVARVTPAQRVGVTPRPAPLPLRQANPTATPAGRRPAPAPTPAPRKRSAGTIVLLAGLALLLLGGTAFGLSQVLGGDEPEPPPNTAAPPSTQATEDGGAGSAVPNEETTVGVLNGTTTNGLAGTLADRLQEEGGYARGTTATNTRDQTLQGSTVYYADGFRAQARSVAELLGVDAVEPMDEETQALAPDSDVVVLAGADQAAQ